jgi:uncharacterized protein YutE (UPF0331/DUF86 family)
MIERLDSEIRAIETCRPDSLDAFLADEDRRYMLEHRLFIALQAVLDIAAHLTVASRAPDVETYRDAVEALASIDVVDMTLATRLAEKAGMRNVLAHSYLGVDQRRVYAALADLDDLKRFAASVWRWMERG